MQLIPVTLTLINPEDIEDRITKVKKKRIDRKTNSYICNETKEQGGCLRNGNCNMFRLSCTMISNHVTSYEKGQKR
jgi:hypothetical protein